MRTLSVHSLGQLTQANIEFGDMTILVGPQASGKSIFLQLLKLTLDYGDIVRTIKKYGFDWQGKMEDFLSLYFGEGMSNIWQPTTEIRVDEKPFDLPQVLSRRGRKKDESLFLIPAQRVIILKNGWPRPFTDYDTGDPYAVKSFSEHLRQLMEAGLGSGKGAIFPQTGRMNQLIREAIEASIFSGAELKLDSSGVRKRIMLSVGNQQLPVMVWSAGQREFMPLLLGLYWLMPSSKISKRKEIEWVVIEEPEMGLHSQAISALLLAFLELVHRGYKVIVSTHSPQILEMVWGLQLLSQRNAPVDAFLRTFNLPRWGFSIALGEDILRQRLFKTYYFDRHNDSVTVKDISTLDPGNADEAIADWGGLTAFSSRVSDIVSEIAEEQL